MKVNDLFGGAGRKTIAKELKKAGYKKIGSGADAVVWSKNEGEVVKIIMPEFENDFNSAVKTVRKFYDFCKKENSPYLPKFTKFVTNEIEEFDLDGQKVLLVSMEKLKPLRSSSNEAKFYWLISELIVLDNPADVIYEQLLYNRDHVIDLMDGDAYAIKGLDYFYKLPEKKWVLDFIDIANKAYDFGKTQDMSWDLHTANIMKRGNTPVIIDPWINFEKAEE